MSAGPLFETDDAIAWKLREVAGELRTVASRRRAFELAAELDELARALEPAEQPGGRA